MILRITPSGTIRTIYTEQIDLAAFGPDQRIVRASHVEPAPAGGWMIDLAPVQGPELGPFKSRSEALETEARWIESNRL